MTKSTWKKFDGPPRRNMTLGCLFFVAGIGIASYCGYSDRYMGDSPDVLKLLGWGLMFAGLILFVLGILYCTRAGLMRFTSPQR